MKRLLKIVNIVKTHPKKIIFFSSLAGIGINYAKQKYDETILMRAYCEEALKFGDRAPSMTDTERHVTVILNPVASDGKGKTNYEKYCAPLLHLAGMKVALVRTEYEGQAKQMMDIMDNTDAVIVAGGDGTLSEVLTGLLGREDSSSAARKFPLGVLPLGLSNTAASSFWGFDKVPEVKHLAEATMSIIRSWKRKMDVVEITDLQSEDGTVGKPVYAASGLEWGPYIEAMERKGVYWYWAYLKKYMVYIFSSYKNLTWDISADLEIFSPCSGCSRCKSAPLPEILPSENSSRRWWQAFLPRPKNNTEVSIDYSSIVNEDCGKSEKLELENVSELQLWTSNTRSSSLMKGHCLALKLGKENVSSTEFIGEGWRRERGKPATFEREMITGEVLLTPKETALKNAKGDDRQFNIDNEKCKVKSLKIRPIPSAVEVFAPPQIS